MPNVKINDLVAAVSVTDTMQIETDISGATSNKVTALQVKTYVLTNLDHGSSLTGLLDDDHTQYAKADGTRWTTTQTASRVPVTNASGHLVVSSTTATQLGFLDATSSIQTQLNSKFGASVDVNHDATTNFVANKHIDHTTVTLTAGTGLSGGGDISSSRTFNIDITELTADTTPDRANDYVITYDASATDHKKVLIDKLVTSTNIDHNGTTNYDANKHIDHTAVSVSAGTGLTGGGTIAANRTISLDIPGLTADTTPDSSADYVVTYDASATTHKKVLLSNLPGGTGSSTFLGLTDTPSSYSGQGGKVVAVNSGATALEFTTVTSGGISTGATLPASPATGEQFLHTPTGRIWLMEYDGTNWACIRSYGTTTLYMDDSVNGSTSWNDGYSTGTYWSITTFLPRLPLIRGGTITINLKDRTFNSTDKLVFPTGMSGEGNVIIIGSITSRGTTTFSSGSTPWQTMTMTATVPTGTAEGDILLYSSGTKPGVSPEKLITEEVDCWCVLSGSGTSLQLAGGIDSIQAPTGTTVFSVNYRNTTLTLADSSFIQCKSLNVEFRFINFEVTGFFGYAGDFGIQFSGCGFNISGSTSRIVSMNLCALFGCYITRTDNTSRWLLSCFGLLPGEIHRTIIKSTSTSSPSTAEVVTLLGAKGNRNVVIGGSRFWHTNSGARIGRIADGAYLNFFTENHTGVTNYSVVGGGTAANWNVSTQGYALRTTTVTQSGTSGAVASVDGATFALSST
jgi:hypothetical protein